MSLLRVSTKCCLPTDRAKRAHTLAAVHLSAPSSVHLVKHGLMGSTNHTALPRVCNPLVSSGRRPSFATAAAGDDAADTIAELRSSAGLQTNLSFIAFWLQLALTLVSAGVLLFSVFITSGGLGNLALDVTKFFTLGGVVLSFISTFFAHGFLTLTRRLREGKMVDVAWLSSSLMHNTTINLLGIAVTTIGLQASVGTLVGKTLLTASQGPIQYNSAGSLVSLDVFALQASTNILLCHLVGLAFGNIMLRIVSKAVPKAAAA